MGRASLVISKADLEREITAAEAAKTFGNHSELFKYICETPWAKTIVDTCGKPRSLSPANIYQRVQEFQITLKTQAGRRGRAVGSAPPVKGKRWKGDAKALRKATPKEYQPLAEKVISGSMKAGIKLKCLECSCYQPKESRHCVVTDCPLHGFLTRIEAKGTEE